MVDTKLDKYIEEYSTQENDILYKLNRETNLSVLRARMISGHVQGQFLKMFVQILKPKNILEIGTFTGYSAISMALGMENNAKLYTIENNDELEEIIDKYISEAKLEDKIELIMGDALSAIQNLNIRFDLVFIDANKREYLNYYNEVIEKLNSGGIIIADDVLWSGKVTQEIKNNDEQTKGIIEFNEFVKNDSRVENVIIPLRHGINIIRKK